MWTVRRESEDGSDGEPRFGVYWKGFLWRGGLSSAEEANSKLDILKTRYLGSTPDLMLRASIYKTKRGGPFCYVLPPGREWSVSSTGIIPASSLREAKQILSTWLQRKRLPAGTSVTRKEE